jgi:curli biogenesis system outer membrane secretion channel CsgG
MKDKVKIPEICMPEYKSVLPTVAVLDFTNNSTFKKASISKSSTTKDSSAIGGIAIGANGIIAGGVSKSNKETIKVSRNIDSKLSQSIVSPLETLIINSGGAKIFTRTDMDKIDTELKFQDSGLVDPASAVEFGKTSGVRYIITGSIDNISQDYTDNSSSANSTAHLANQGNNKNLKVLTALMALGSSITDGMTIGVKFTVKILDVQTGKIVFSETLKGDTNIGKIVKPTYDQIVGAVKKVMINQLPTLKKELSTYFSVKGYITQLRKKDDEIIAQVNIGRDLKVVENQLFKVYSFEEIEDPMTGKKSCDVIEIQTKLKASQQITQKTTWVTIQDGKGSSLKLGQLVQKSYKKGGFEISKF